MSGFHDTSLSISGFHDTSLSIFCLLRVQNKDDIACPPELSAAETAES